MKAKTIPIIRKTALLDEWVIITRYTKKDDHILAHIKYPIPKSDIEYIANDYLITQLKDCEKGYTYRTGSITEGTFCKVTVERIKETKLEDCLVCKRFDDINKICFDYPELNFDDARKECAVHDRNVVHGV